MKIQYFAKAAIWLRGIIGGMFEGSRMDLELLSGGIVESRCSI